ncbi:hypothetical protein STCU_09506 [Strigomonas culicis]|uniref:Uncharacterized protein n=1 Tax=Strigomonas culicis TaxID=28005 RepID=S9UXQ5_9TRYP|nr:hypothetical protein STCU_09506 [Strigomonas culicis]|eukprot:EPY19351.1 hypothetical protein STCU_09506 [Strigomonas culicis]
MFRFNGVCLRKSTLLAAAPLLRNRSSFKPFTQQDEEELVRVIKTKPRHVLRHVRQQVWKSRKRELHFRSTVTHLMIVLQEFLRKKLLDPAQASQIMEGVLQECVVYAQHDMAHLLFRASLRFRKYGCVVTVNSIRALFDSYKRSDSSDLMVQLGNEMKSDASLRPLCIAAYLFGGREEEADALWGGVSATTLTKDDFLALVSGYEKLKKCEKLLALVDMVQEGNLSKEERGDVLGAILRCFYQLDDDASFTKVLQHVVDQSIHLDTQTFAIVLRQKMRRVTAPEEIEAVENELKALGYVPDIQGNSIIITAYARLVHFGDRGSEELMLSKVDTLLSSIESRLKQGDPDLDISAAHIRAVIRGYGAAGKPDSIKSAWSRMQYGSITKDVRIYNELFKWFALMGIVKDVLLLKDEMEAAQVHPDSATYTWMIRALGKFYPRHVDRIYTELRSRQVRPDIQLYTTLLGVLGDLGKMDEVQQLWEEMQKREESGTLQLTPITFAVLIRVYGSDAEKALAIYDACKHRNLHLHSHVQTSFIHALFNTTNGIEKVEKFAKSIETWDSDVYNVLLSTYSKANEKDRFLATLEKMQADGVSMNDVTFGTLITAFSRWGDEGKVQDVIQLLKEHEGEISPTFYSVLASSLNRLGHAEGVSDAWNDLVSSKLFPDTEVYNQFLSLYSRQHNIEKMQGVLDNMMKQVPPNPVTATTVLDVLGKSGRVSEMESLFEDMKASPDTQPTSVTYHQLLNTYAKTGDIVKMEKTHSEFLSQGHTENAVTFNISWMAMADLRTLSKWKRFCAGARKAAWP